MLKARVSAPKGRGQPLLIKGGRLGGLRFLAIAFNIPEYAMLRPKGAIWVNSLERERTAYTVLYDVMKNFCFASAKHYLGL